MPLKEQLAVQPVRKRASLPASPHRAGHYSGIHPEDQPYQSDEFEEYETDEDDAIYPARKPSSAVRYPMLDASVERQRFIDRDGNQVIRQGNKEIVIHNEPPPQRHIHWSLILGIGMVLMLGLYLGVSWLGTWVTEQQETLTYGMPRTYQIDAVVYPGDSVANPSHYIFLNLHGNVQIIEEPHGDAAHARIYKGPTIFLDDAARIPVTGEFQMVNGKIEMLVHIQDKTIIYVNNGTQFIPK